MGTMGSVMMIVWAGLGLQIENTKENIESLEIWISVPEHSHHKNAKGEEMAGMNLAKRFKTTLVEMGVKRLTVKARIRAGEYWTEEMSQVAELEMQKTIYGSQY